MIFSDKNFEIYILMILVYFPSGGYVDDVVNNRTNYQCTSVMACRSVLDYQKNCF